MKKYFLAFTMSFFLIFNSFVPHLVFANAFVPVVATPLISESAGDLGVALAPFAPEIALVAVVCVGGGIIFENREEISVVAGSIYQKMKAQGIAFGTTTASGAMSVGSAALSFINSQIDSLKSSGNISWSVPKDTNNFVLPMALMLNHFELPINANILYYLNNVQHVIVSTTVLVFSAEIIDQWDMVVKYYDSTATLQTFTIAPYTDVSVMGYLGDKSICVDVPSSMTSTPSVVAPYVVDTTLNIPADLTFDHSGTASWEDSLVGKTDWTQIFPITGGTTTTQDIPQVVNTAVNALASILGVTATRVENLWNIITPSSTVSINVEDIQTSEADKKAEEDGVPRIRHKVYPIGTKTMFPKLGPNSSSDLLNPDGSVKQRRYYGNDGLAEEDIDYNHSDDGTHTFPHIHKWDWTQETPRQPSED